MQQVSHVVEGAPAQVNLPGDGLLDPDSFDQVTHGEFHVVYSACPESRRLVKLLIIAGGQHPNDDQYESAAYNPTPKPVPPLPGLLGGQPRGIVRGRAAYPGAPPTGPS